MAFSNASSNGASITNSRDLVCNSISLTNPDGSLTSLTLGGTVAPATNPNFQGSVAGVTKDMVGLGNVANFAPADLPVSTATQQALNLKSDQSTTYNKTQVDTVLAAKQNTITDGSLTIAKTSGLQNKFRFKG